MPQGTKVVGIDDGKKKETYEIHNLPTSRALRLLSKLGSNLLGPVGDLVKALEPDAKPGSDRKAFSFADMDLDLGAVGGAIARLAEKMGESDDVVYIFKELVSVTRLKVGEGHEASFLEMDDDLFESHFAGRTGHLVKVATESLRHNFADFFSDLSGHAKRLGLGRKGRNDTTQGQPPSTGASGAPSLKGPRRS